LVRYFELPHDQTICREIVRLEVPARTRRQLQFKKDAAIVPMLFSCLVLAEDVEVGVEEKRNKTRREELAVVFGAVEEGEERAVEEPLRRKSGLAKTR
jgi:hypothetical protein